MDRVGRLARDAPDQRDVRGAVEPPNGVVAAVDVRDAKVALGAGHHVRGGHAGRQRARGRHGAGQSGRAGGEYEGATSHRDLRGGKSGAPYQEGVEACEQPLGRAYRPGDGARIAWPASALAWLPCLLAAR